MIKFGTSDSLVIPLVLPGMLLTVGAAVVLHVHSPNIAWSALDLLDDSLRSPADTTQSFGPAIAALVAALALAIYVASVFVGAILAILAANIELLTLDRLQVKRSSHEAYWSQWYRYVEHLEQQSTENAYLAGLADMFVFQLRSSVASILLAALAGYLGARSDWTTSLVAFSVGFLVLAGLFFYSSSRYHNDLAHIRRRRFADPPRVLRDAIELLGALIERWCDRQVLPALAIVLPIWPPKDTKADLAAAALAVATASDLPGATVFESERDTLKAVRRLLEAEAAKR